MSGTKLRSLLESRLLTLETLLTKLLVWKLGKLLRNKALWLLELLLLLEVLLVELSSKWLLLVEIEALW